MEVTSRQRPVVLLVAVVLAQVLLLAFQIKREHDVLLIRVWSAELVTPLESLGTNIISGISEVWSGYLGLRHAHAENQQLRAELARLELRNHQLEGEAAEAARFSRLLGFRQENPDVPMVAAEVIGASADSSSRTIFINRGDREGLRRNMAVITPEGVVGKITEVSPHVAQVLLITDKESGVGALFAGTRAHGIIKGSGDPLLHMDYVTSDEKVSVGDKVLTSGEDRIFPKDLPIGTVTSAKSAYPFQTIFVQPAAHLDRLEEVLVLQTEQPLTRQQASSAPPEKNENPVASSGGANTSRVSTGTSLLKKPAPNSSEPKSASPKLIVPKAAPAKKPAGTAKSSGANGASVGRSAVLSQNPAGTMTAAPKPPAAKPAAPAKKPGGGAEPSGANPPGTPN
jgi:rod shape-determining protein MreC